MLFINGEKMEQKPGGVTVITKKQKRRALIFIQGAVYAWCNTREKVEFSANDLFGGDNSNWAGTPLQCIYRGYKNTCEGNDEDENDKEAQASAGQAVGRLLTICLINDKRRFDRNTGDGYEHSATYSWSEECEAD